MHFDVGTLGAAKGPEANQLARAGAALRARPLTSAWGVSCCTDAANACTDCSLVMSTSASSTPSSATSSLAWEGCLGAGTRGAEAGREQ